MKADTRYTIQYDIRMAIDGGASAAIVLPGTVLSALGAPSIYNISILKSEE